MKLPNGRHVNGWWVALAILLMVFLLGLIPHATDMQWAQGR